MAFDFTKYFFSDFSAQLKTFKIYTNHQLLYKGHLLIPKRVVGTILDKIFLELDPREIIQHGKPITDQVQVPEIKIKVILLSLFVEIQELLEEILEGESNGIDSLTYHI